MNAVKKWINIRNLKMYQLLFHNQIVDPKCNGMVLKDSHP